MAGAAHLADVVLAVAVHAFVEAQFDEVRHLRQVAQDVERPQVGMRFGARGEGDGRHDHNNFTSSGENERPRSQKTSETFVYIVKK